MAALRCTFRFRSSVGIAGVSVKCLLLLQRTVCRETLSALKPGVPVEIGEKFRELTLEIISEVTLGLSVSDSHVLPE